MSELRASAPRAERRRLQREMKKGAKKFACALDYARQHVLQCALCDEEPIFFGVYVPTSAQGNAIVGCPPGKWRIAVYGLCEACFARPDKLSAVEAGLMAATVEPATKVIQ